MIALELSYFPIEMIIYIKKMSRFEEVSPEEIKRIV